MTTEQIERIEKEFDERFECKGCSASANDMGCSCYSEIKSFIFEQIEQALKEQRDGFVGEIKLKRQSEKGWPQCAGLGCHDDEPNMNGIIFNSGLQTVIDIINKRV